MTERGASQGFVPMRTCIGCRRVAPKATLVRITRQDGRPVLDARQRLPGRGAYLCPRQGCFRHADRRGALQRAFRAGPGPEGVLAELWTSVSTSGAPGAGPDPRGTGARRGRGLGAE